VSTMSGAKNLLFITTDQQRFDSLPSYGARFAIAPNLERLAAEGVVFQRCYVPAPICVPTRASLMTGQFPTAHGATDNSSWLADDATKWTDSAVAAGYTAAAIGKMHFAPWDAMEGFDERIICEDKRHFYLPDDHAQFMRSHGIERPHPKDVAGYFETCGAPDFPFATELYPDLFIADQSVKWIKERGHEPFALWVSFIGPHDPYDPPAEYSDRYANAPIPAPIPPPDDPASAPSFEAQGATQPGIGNSVFRLDATKATPEQMMGWRRHYFGNITLIDEGIGKIVQALQEKGLLDNTVIVFTSDHGDALGDHGMVFKSFFYESMVHVPLIIRDGTHRGRRDALVGTTDVVAYFHEMLRLDTPPLLQGKSLAPILENEAAVINQFVFSEMPERMMVFDGRYKYVHAADGRHELYDLEQDPDEMRNIVDDPGLQARVGGLRDALIRHQMDSTRVYGACRKKLAYAPRVQMEAEYRASLRSEAP